MLIRQHEGDDGEYANIPSGVDQQATIIQLENSPLIASTRSALGHFVGHYE